MGIFKKDQWRATFYLLPNTQPLECSFDAKHLFEGLDESETEIVGKLIEPVNLQELQSGETSQDVNDLTAELQLKYYTTKKSKELTRIDASVLLLTNGFFYKKHSLTLHATDERKRIGAG